MRRIIALTGLAGSGKSTVAYLLTKAGGEQIAFAEPLKRFCGEVFGFTRAQLYGPSAERERPSPRFTRPDGTPLTPRYALQTLGTEWGRNCDPDVWAKAGLLKAEQLAGAGQLVVITDLRFVNEAQLVRAAGGEIWRVLRSYDDLKHNSFAHASEREIWSQAMDRLVSFHVDNTGTLEQLAELVRATLDVSRDCQQSDSV